MKKPLASLHLVLPLTSLLLSGFAAAGVTFTSDTLISPNNTNYDGMDIAVTNCTLTVDGAHSFASLQVLKGGVLTHTYDASGQVVYRHSVTNEAQVLSLTNVATLAGTNVIYESIVVRDITGSITYTNFLDYVIGLDVNATMTLLLTTNSAIAEGSTNLVSYDVRDAVVAAGLRLTVTGDVWVAPDGNVSADGKGYGGGQGYGSGQSSGSPLSGSGAGHGGYGGQSAALTGSGTFYDSIQMPSLLGSGGGAGYGGIGGAGGGLVKLVVGGALGVDGVVSANGANGLNARSGGGSGGTIYLSAQNFTGTGLLSAGGGAGEPTQGGGGAGGRISLQYGASSFSGTAAAAGGSGYVCGGAGTTYSRAASQSSGQVLVANAGTVGASTPVVTGEALDLTVQRGAVIPLPASMTVGNLLVGSNAWIRPDNRMLTVTGNAMIEAGGGIIGDGLGYRGGTGPGAGGFSTTGYSYTGGGGGYGGYGAAGGGASAYGGLSYGTVIAPENLGSGGGGFPHLSLGGGGGGAIRVNVTGMLLLDGRISADGEAGFDEGTGGGSGGSIWLTVGTLAGSGTISANGGVGSGVGLWGGGGGGGGRIAVQYGLNLFFGIVSSRGGSGAAWGGAGTIYTKANAQPWGHVLVDNGGQTGTNTTLGSTSPGTVDLTVQGGAALVPPASQTIGSLLVASNAWLYMTNYLVTVSSNATIQAGGGILADGAGYPGNTGPGGGRFYYSGGTYIGGGGGYGGYGAAGGAPSGYNAFGGNAYGSLISPGDVGSGGGGTVSLGYGVGGSGGGSIRLNVTGVLQVDGRISAAGSPGTAPSAGGGSGGCILLTAGTLTGSGSISANGGMGNYLGGGGAGGRIAVFYEASTFSGLMSAYGGGGYGWGGAGTIYTRANSRTPGQVLLDNGGQSGTNTSLGYSTQEPIDLVVKNGAALSPSPSQTFASLLVASNGWLSMSNQFLTVQGNATIQAGGGIVADGTGYGPGQGPGAGGYGYSSPFHYFGGGGGYGGYGGIGAGLESIPPVYTVDGGNAYGSATSPLDRGSGGGSSSPYVLGGAGGGVIRITVTGALQVDGRISAAGMPPSYPDAGGGSGGSILLTVGTLAGSGTISADGGTSSGSGGGGSGGRIAISCSGANAFSGVLSACGGRGYGGGGAGTIFTRSYAQQYGLVLVDNGGLSGTNTTLGSYPGTVDLTVRGGGVLAPPPSQAFSTLVLASNGWLKVANQSLTVLGNATIQTGGGILADGTGYPGGQGIGAGKYISTQYGYVSGGGGYGGYGAASGGTPAAAAGGTPYGSLTSPLDRGSGGGSYLPSVAGGTGGGLVNLTVNGALEVSGIISASGVAGTNGQAGGGSGGSIRLVVGSLAGSGRLCADGGPGIGLGGGGGGGRIAITYNVNSFAGIMSACGGGGSAWGGAGTIYTKANTQPWGQVLVDNGGHAGTNTTWTTGEAVDLTVGSGAVFAPSSSQTFRNLLVTSNGWISLSSQLLIVISNATVLAGGGIVADGTGYAGNQGPGAGKYGNNPYGYVGGGAGHAGYGAASGGSPAAAGGTTYGSVITPLEFGSGGGGYSSLYTGGAGGGAVRLNVSGALVVNGRISANGGDGLGQGAGGGSGGSVWLTAGTLAGAGIISANGGMGDAFGGGGGGGCVALQYRLNTFNGVTSARGGGGYAWGGAGTIYAKAENQTTGRVLIDNGGHVGTNTPVYLASPFDLTVTGGAVAHPTSSYLVLSNLLLTGGGALTCLKTQTNLDLAVLRNATIETGSGISVDGKGFAGFTGPGAGQSTNSIGSGAGYGGHGGASSLSPGGGTYGSAQQPVDRGSGGGPGYGALAGGSEGGGAIRLSVGGTLMANGLLSANGNAGLQEDAGGGSGGSIWLTAGALAGNGIFAADGGAGESYGGGGGGGGRIAIYTPVNVFGGSVSAAGGEGLSPGQDGSTYYASDIAALQVVSATPAGVITPPISSATITFSTPLNPYSLAGTVITLAGPGGLALSNLTAGALSPYSLRIDFATQTAEGDYTLTVGPQLQDLYGHAMSQAYTNTFTAVWATIQGTITDTNGQPVPGVVVQSDGGGAAATTDTNGSYVLGVPPSGLVTVTPSRSGLMFVPAFRTYTEVTADITNQNYLAVRTTAPTTTTAVQTNSMVLSWYGIPGITYQPFYSTNLLEWLPYDGVITGTNGPLQLVVPMDTSSIMFFRMSASY